VTGFPEIKPDEKGKKHETDEIPPNRIGHPMHAKIYAGNGNQRNKKNGKNNDKRPKNPGKFRRGKHEDREIPLRRLWVLDLQFLGRFGYWFTAFQFTLAALLYLSLRLIRRERFVVYTIDMDSASFAPLAWIPRPIFAEMHSNKKAQPLVRYFFKRARIIATNQPISASLFKTFDLDRRRLCVEPNGVDEKNLGEIISRQEARDGMFSGSQCIFLQAPLGTCLKRASKTDYEDVRRLHDEFTNSGQGFALKLTRLGATVHHVDADRSLRPVIIDVVAHVPVLRERVRHSLNAAWLFPDHNATRLAQPAVA
jgi:hypothetical protein